MRIGITGASGYVGSAVRRGAELAGHDVITFGRRPSGEGSWRPFRLGEPATPEVRDLDALVHCAHDFGVLGDDIARVNVDGARRLLTACRRSSVPVVLLSSMSAYDGAPSRYGRAKRALEAIVVAQGGAAVRAGVVFGPCAGGILGALRQAVESHPVVPMFGGGHQALFASHVDAVVAEAIDLASGRRPTSIVFGAHRSPTTLRQLVGALADAQATRTTVVSVPWRIGYAGLRLAELAGRPMPFRSDSLLSLIHPAPIAQLAWLDEGCGDYLPFALELTEVEIDALHRPGDGRRSSAQMLPASVG